MGVKNNVLILLGRFTLTLKSWSSTTHFLLVTFLISIHGPKICSHLHCKVDAHVGKSLFEDAIIGELRSRGITVLLVTHAIHFLSQVDYIYTINNGTIVESGTYEELVNKNGEFARLDRDYGGQTEEAQKEEGVESAATPSKNVTIEDAKNKSAEARERAEGKGKAEGRLIVKEQREIGSMSSQGKPGFAVGLALTPNYGLPQCTRRISPLDAASPPSRSFYCSSF